MIPRTGRFAWTRRATALGFLVLLALGARAEVWWFRGSTTGTEILGVVPLADPLAAFEISLASGALPDLDVVVGALLLLGFAMLMGPVFCGYVCPVGFLADLNDGLRRRVQHRLRRSRRSLPELAVPADARFAVLGTVLGVALITGLPAFQLVSPINVVGWAVAFAAGPALIALGALLLVEWFAPRLWCRSLCPLGAVYASAGRFAPFRVRVVLAEAGRTPCELCTRHCPMGIPVMEDYALRGRRSIGDIACTRCGSCVDACPRGVLRAGFRDPNPRLAEVSA